MDEHICKKCGEPMQFVGSLLSGRLECPECAGVMQLAKNIELARLEFEEDAKSDMLNVAQHAGIKLSAALRKAMLDEPCALGYAQPWRLALEGEWMVNMPRLPK